VASLWWVGCLAITNQPDTPLLFKSLNTSSNHNSNPMSEKINSL